MTKKVPKDLKSYQIGINNEVVACDKAEIDTYGTEHLVLLGYKNNKLVVAVNLSSEYFEYMMLE